MPPDAADRAAGADAHHEVGHASVGLLPDLWARLLVVRRGVRQIVVLIRLPGVWNLLLEPRRHRVVRTRILGIDVGRADDDFGAECPERVDLLLRLFVGGRKHATVALDDRRNREAHPGIPRRAFDNRSTWLEQALPLGVLDHPHGHAVLDRIAGIDGLDFGEDRRLDEVLRDPVDPDHRRVADRFEDVVEDLLLRRDCAHGISLALQHQLGHEVEQDRQYEEPDDTLEKKGRSLFLW